jgi:hypothetical protein
MVALMIFTLAGRGDDDPGLPGTRGSTVDGMPGDDGDLGLEPGRWLKGIASSSISEVCYSL